MFLKFTVLIPLLFLVFLCSNPQSVYGVEGASLAIADSVLVQDKGVNDGDIIVANGNVYQKSRQAYDSGLVGVVSFNSAISFNTATSSGKENVFPLVSRGNVRVWVSGEGGAIKKGDLITSSSKSGVGMKATKGGFVLGTALEDFNGKGDELKKIMINISIRPIFGAGTGGAVQRNLSDITNLSKLATYENPVVVFKYVLAAFVVVLSCVAGFLLFGRIAGKGIEALARNPLMGKKIQFGIVLNTAISLSFAAAGIVVAYFIIRI